MSSRFGYPSAGEIDGGPPDTTFYNSTGNDAGNAIPLAKDAGVAGPRLKKTDGAVTEGKNGSFSWPATWSIDNATATTEGWIVQHVELTQNITDKAGKVVTPQQGGYGGLSTAWYPIWEAWQVRGGKVFIGDSAAPHSADTFAQNEVGANTTGTTAIVGTADFYPALKLPASFKATNAAPAWALPVTKTDPALAGGTGVVNHNLTAKWDGVGSTGATKVTTA